MAPAGAAPTPRPRGATRRGHPKRAGVQAAFQPPSSPKPRALQAGWSGRRASQHRDRRTSPAPSPPRWDGSGDEGGGLQLLPRLHPLMPRPTCCPPTQDHPFISLSLSHVGTGTPTEEASPCKCHTPRGDEGRALPALPLSALSQLPTRGSRGCPPSPPTPHRDPRGCQQCRPTGSGAGSEGRRR